MRIILFVMLRIASNREESGRMDSKVLKKTPDLSLSITRQGIQVGRPTVTLKVRRMVNTVSLPLIRWCFTIGLPTVPRSKRSTRLQAVPCVLGGIGVEIATLSISLDQPSDIPGSCDTALIRVSVQMISAV
jgi:hypothetical protein